MNKDTGLKKHNVSYNEVVYTKAKAKATRLLTDVSKVLRRLLYLWVMGHIDLADYEGK